MVSGEDLKPLEGEGFSLGEERKGGGNSQSKWHVVKNQSSYKKKRY